MERSLAGGGGGGGGQRECMPSLGMVAVQVGYAGLSVVSKLAMDEGMSPFVLIAYRNIFAAVVLFAAAFLFERQALRSITMRVAMQILLCSFFGATLNQIFFFLGLKYSTPTIAAALNNMLPAITFIMAVPFRMERVGLRTWSGQAKVVGTLICVGGSMLMTFYKGSLLRVWHSPIHWSYAQQHMPSGGGGGGQSSNIPLGVAFVLASCLAWALWLIIQTKMSASFSSPNTTTALFCGMASVQCVAIAACFDTEPAAWALGSNIRLFASLYLGLIGSGLTVFVTTWCLEKKGPLFVSMFNPLTLVIVAVLDWGILNAQLYVGSVVGSACIVAGLYMVLWGKRREMKRAIDDAADEKEKEDESPAAVIQMPASLAASPTSPNH